MRDWDDKDGNGKKLTDGRVCLVIEPDDQNLPDIRTYGRDKDEVLEKVAKTAETAQAEIHRLRNSRSAATPPARTIPPNGAAPSSAAPSTRLTLTADETARATADLSNPAKSSEAVKTLLRGAGVDVDAIRFREDTTRMANVAKEWERAHPDPIWEDERNQRLLIDTAVLHFGFRQNMAAAAIDGAYDYLLQHNILFKVPEASSTVQPDGNPDSRTVRNATTYRGNSLRATHPVAARENPKAFLAEVDKLNSKELRDKIENEPGFKDKYEKAIAAAAA